MAFVADDIAEAALGPWGLLIGVGVGAALLARKRLVPAAGTAAAGGMEAGEKARDWAAGLPLVERAQTMLAEAGDWWSDLYAEAKSEWEANRHGSADGTDDANERLEQAAESGQRRRDATGRFLKADEA